MSCYDRVTVYASIHCLIVKISVVCNLLTVFSLTNNRPLGENTIKISPKQSVNVVHWVAANPDNLWCSS